MDLLTLLAAVSGAACLGGAVGAVRDSHPGFGGYVVAIVIGALLGLCNAGMVMQAGIALGRFTASSPKARQEWWGRAFILVIFVWLPVAVVLVSWVTTHLMRWV